MKNDLRNIKLNDLPGQHIVEVISRETQTSFRGYPYTRYVLHLIKTESLFAGMEVEHVEIPHPFGQPGPDIEIGDQLAAVVGPERRTATGRVTRDVRFTRLFRPVKS